MGTRKNRLVETVLTCTYNRCFEQNLEILFCLFLSPENCLFTAVYRHAVGSAVTPLIEGMQSMFRRNGEAIFGLINAPSP